MITRYVPIDFADLFKQAGIEPCRCTLAKPLCAGGDWCLMIHHPEDNHSEFIVVQPPALLGDETAVQIIGKEWVYTAQPNKVKP